ncbi:hypothetical protein AMQ83_05135, partial [Paenibacillus riograndensis]
LMNYKKETFASYPDNAEKGFRSQNADTLIGEASFINEHTLMINNEKYHGSKIIIATGQKPNKLPIKGKEFTYSSNEVLSMEQLPKRVTFIGGGFVSMELATILNAAGSHVEIIEFADRPLKPFYSEHVKDVVSEMIAQGITFHLNQSVHEIEKVNSHFNVKTAQGLIIETDLVVDASGRIPNIGSLNLDNAGIKYDRGGILVNEFLETNVSGVYAAGDVVSKDPRIAPKLTSTAHFEGEYLSENLENNNPVPIKYPVIATASFTFPQIAQAGVNVDEALNNPDYTVNTYDLTPDFFYTGTNDYNAKITLVLDKTNKLVGASEVSQTAADDINNFVDVIGLNNDPRSWKKDFLPIFPALAYKVRDFV